MRALDGGATPHPGSERAPHRPRVVVCDADEISSRLTTEILRRMDFDVRGCATAGECEAEVRNAPTDLVVTTILLPDLDGLELTGRLRSVYPELQIVVVSALRAANRAIEVGANTFLSMPINAAQLTSTVRELMPTAPFMAE